MAIELQIVKNDFSELDITSNETFFTEDLYQAVYENYAIDCGWYNAGYFVTFLIKDSDWDLPVLRIETRDLNAAKWSIKTCIEYLNEIVTNA